MSRGPGTVERAITAAFHGSPDTIFTAGDLVALAYPCVSPQPSQRGATLRAAAKVADRLGWRSQRMTSSGRGGKPLVYFNPASRRSVVLADLTCATSLAQQLELHAELESLSGSQPD